MASTSTAPGRGRGLERDQVARGGLVAGHGERGGVGAGAVALPAGGAAGAQHLAWQGCADGRARPWPVVAGVVGRCEVAGAKALGRARCGRTAVGAHRGRLVQHRLGPGEAGLCRFEGGGATHLVAGDPKFGQYMPLRPGCQQQAGAEHDQQHDEAGGTGAVARQRAVGCPAAAVCRNVRCHGGQRPETASLRTRMLVRSVRCTRGRRAIGPSGRGSRVVPGCAEGTGPRRVRPEGRAGRRAPAPRARRGRGAGR